MSRRGPILVVEDDHDIRDALAEILTEEGFEVDAAGNGREAIDYLVTRPAPAVILLDLMMPDFDGFQFRKAQLADARFAEIPVIVLTADRHARDRHGDLAPAAFLTKPIDLDELLGLLRHLA